MVMEQIASEGLKHRIFEVSLSDLSENGDEDNAYRKIRLRAEDVQGRNVLTQFWVRYYKETTSFRFCLFHA